MRQALFWCVPTVNEGPDGKRNASASNACIIAAFFNPLMETLGADLPRLLGQGEGDHQLTLFKGALRKQMFEKARAAVAAWKFDSLKNIGFTIINYVQKNADELRARWLDAFG